MKLENASQGVSYHTGLSLATENVLQCAGLNPSSIAVSGVFLEKRPNCVKQDTSQLVSGLTLRSRYLGEVNRHFRGIILTENAKYIVCNGSSQISLFMVRLLKVFILYFISGPFSFLT